MGAAATAGPARRLLRLAASPAALAALALPPASAAAWAAARGLGLQDWTDSTAVRAWCAGLALSLAAAAARAGLEARWPRALAAAGALALLGQPFAWRAFGLSGECDLVEGSAVPEWKWLERGWGGTPPALDLVEAPVAGAGAARLRAGGEEAAMDVGATRRVGGLRLTLLGVGAAPTFAVLDATGEVIEGGLFKLSTEAGLIEVPSLPHRFSFAAGAGARLDPVTGLPSALEVRIQRGKLSLFSGRLEEGREAEFDGLKLGWSEGARWAAVRVTRRPAPILALAGLFLLADAAALAWLGRKR